MSTLSNPPPRARSSDPTAPVRFVEGGGTEYERHLFDAAARQLPPPASADRVAAALRAAAIAGPALDPGALQHAQSPSTGDATGLVKPWALGILAVGLIGLVVAGRGSLVTDEPLPSAPGVAAIPAPAAPVPALRSDPLPPETVTRNPFVSAPAPPPRELAKPRHIKAPGPTRPPAVAPQPRAQREANDLAAEVRAIEHIQTLLAWGETEPARVALVEYGERFRNGELAVEADLLNVDIAVARGEREEAKRLAQALLERPAASRYRERLNAVLEADSVGSKRGPR